MNSRIVVYLLFVGFMFIGSFGGIILYYNTSVNVLGEQTAHYFEAIAHSRANHLENCLSSTLDSVKIIVSFDCIKENMYNVAYGIEVEESTAKITRAFSAFEGITNFVLKALEPLGEFLIDGIVAGFEAAGTVARAKLKNRAF